jgi:hypothetical protein
MAPGFARDTAHTKRRGIERKEAQPERSIAVTGVRSVPPFFHHVEMPRKRGPEFLHRPFSRHIPRCSQIGGTLTVAGRINRKFEELNDRPVF